MWSNERENRVFNKGMYEISIRCRATNMILGTTPGNKDIYREYIADNAPTIEKTEEEVAALESTLSKFEGEEQKKIAPTVFPVGKFFKTPDNVFYDPIYDVVPDRPDLEMVEVPFMWDYQMRGSFKEGIQMISRASQDKVAKKEARAAAAAGEEVPVTEEAPKKRGRKKKEETAEAAEAAMGTGNKYASAKITSYKKTVDGGWFVKQRRIPFLVPETWIDDLGNEHPTWKENENGTRSLNLYVRPLRADTPQGPRTALAASEFLPAGTEFYLTIQLLNPKDRDALLETLDFREKVGILQFRGGGKGTIIWTPSDKDGHPIDEIP